MKKINQLKKWLTLEDTARQLSVLMDEVVNETDVLQLGLDGHLKLSVNLINGAFAKRGKIVTYEQAKRWILPCDMSKLKMKDLAELCQNEVTLEDSLPEEKKKGLQDQTLHYVIAGIVIQDNEILELEKEISRLQVDVYDLPMFGSERMYIENTFQMKTGGAAVTSTERFLLDGAFVIDTDGQWCQLQTNHCYDIESLNYGEDESARKPPFHPDNYYPGSLPDDSVLVVRTDELATFETRISESEGGIEKPLVESERSSLLKLVIGMAIKGYRYKPEEKKSKVISEIKADLEELGIALDVDTIRKYLKKASEKLPAKLINT